MSKIVSVFGSARVKPKSQVYEASYAVGKALAQAGYITMTGGFAGVMEAASKGAVEADGQAYGVTVESLGLIGESTANQWLTKEFSYPHISERIQHLIHKADAYIVMPGGIGTVQELIEVWQGMRIGDVPSKPIFAYGEFWKPFIQDMLSEGFIGAKDRSMVSQVDNPQAIIASLQTWFS